MLRIARIAALAAVAALCWSPTALAKGGNYVFDGGTTEQRSQVRAALNASTFDWSVVPGTVTVHVIRGMNSQARPGHIWLDASLLESGMFGWAVVQDEYAHQVDFFLLDQADRAVLTKALGAKDWCYGTPNLRHSDYGCERFASTLVWSYWQSDANTYRPRSRSDESAALAPAPFRALMSRLLSS